MRRCLISRWPPSQLSFAESFLTKPISLSIVNNNLDAGTRTIGEDKKLTGEGILPKLNPTDSS